MHLILRPHGENTTTAVAGTTLEDVYGYLAQAPPDPNAGPLLTNAGTLPSKNSIEIILGNEKTYFYY